MRITTRDFGQLELDEKELLRFRTPIFGFEGLEKYALLSDDEAGAGLLWLQSVDDPGTCFILLAPEELGLEYAPGLPADVKLELELEGAPTFRLIAVVPANFKDTTVNLKSPIVINPDKKLAAQVILEDDYPIRMPLFGTQEGEGC